LLQELHPLESQMLGHPSESSCWEFLAACFVVGIPHSSQAPSQALLGHGNPRFSCASSVLLLINRKRWGCYARHISSDREDIMPICGPAFVLQAGARLHKQVQDTTRLLLRCSSWQFVVCSGCRTCSCGTLFSLPVIVFRIWGI
jgi:hypothetical protein